MKSERTINLPSDLRIESEFVKKRVASSVVLHSMPRRKKILGFNSHQMSGALGFVSDDLRMTKHQSFAASFDDGVSKLRRFIASNNDATFRGHHDFVPVRVGKVHSFKPSANSVRKIKRHEPASLGEHSVPDCFHGLNIATATAPNLAVKSHSTRKPVGEAGRSFDDVSVASPKVVSVPKRPASVKLFRPEISGAIPEVPVSRQGHVLFVHGASVACPQLSAMEIYAR